MQKKYYEYFWKLAKYRGINNSEIKIIIYLF